ncbi:MAG TPA: DNA-binding protein [Leptolyngbyaceae cyanobacterium M33_DOE_097]|uniref:DNA-binding protein n=1 Tax=Oscillatoriales cyanobacterium SpSt-418 TaxID=2282169 RepID=A0A7C3PQ26_9CYAN|nr:DNA-binding protein [Leptolyngbyaceae cyanobacterium M33_DOE_097]
MQLFAVRLQANQDLKQELREFVQKNQIKAGCILTGIGSLQQAVIRFANQPNVVPLTEYFEIISLSGTLSIYGIHLHIAIADANGKVLGGHLSDGSIIYTTAEIVLAEATHLTFLRTPDPQTGYQELEIAQNQ